jgi:hypothetical protein
MSLGKQLKKPTNKSESIFENDYRLRQEAKQLAKNHKDTKPIKYLLK